MLSLMRLKNYPHFLTLVVLFCTLLGSTGPIQASPDTKITPDPVPVLKKQGKKKEAPIPPPAETALPTLQISTPTDKFRVDDDKD